MKKQVLMICVALFSFAAISFTGYKEIPKDFSRSAKAPGTTYITRVSAAKEVVMHVVKTGNTYDVYVSTQAAANGRPVRAVFPDMETAVVENVGYVAIEAGKPYTYINANDPSNLEEVSMQAGGTITYTCPCCTGQGNCMITGSVEPGGEPTFDCDASTCTPPQDGTVTCELKQSGSGIKGGGVMLQSAKANITIHWQ